MDEETRCLYFVFLRNFFRNVAEAQYRVVGSMLDISPLADVSCWRCSDKHVSDIVRPAHRYSWHVMTGDVVALSGAEVLPRPRVGRQLLWPDPHLVCFGCLLFNTFLSVAILVANEIHKSLSLQNF